MYSYNNKEISPWGKNLRILYMGLYIYLFLFLYFLEQMLFNTYLFSFYFF